MAESWAGRHVGLHAPKRRRDRRTPRRCARGRRSSRPAKRERLGVRRAGASATSRRFPRRRGRTTEWPPDHHPCWESPPTLGAVVSKKPAPVHSPRRTRRVRRDPTPRQAPAFLDSFFDSHGCRPFRPRPGGGRGPGPSLRSSPGCKVAGLRPRRCVGVAGRGEAAIRGGCGRFAWEDPTVSSLRLMK
jgi:hypothetical protein